MALQQRYTQVALAIFSFLLNNLYYVIRFFAIFVQDAALAKELSANFMEELSEGMFTRAAYFYRFIFLSQWHVDPI